MRFRALAVAAVALTLAVTGVPAPAGAGATTGASTQDLRVCFRDMPSLIGYGINKICYLRRASDGRLQVGYYSPINDTWAPITGFLSLVDPVNVSWSVTGVDDGFTFTAILGPELNTGYGGAR